MTASHEYTKDIMIRAAEYALQAKHAFGEELARSPSEVIESKYGDALYWMGLNFATLCRLGGCQQWGCQQSYDMANTALAECQKLRAGNVAEHLTAEVTFAQGVLSFCKGEAVKAGHLKSIKMEKNVLVERKYLQALQASKPLECSESWKMTGEERGGEVVVAVEAVAC